MCGEYEYSSFRNTSALKIKKFDYVVLENQDETVSLLYFIFEHFDKVFSRHSVADITNLTVAFSFPKATMRHIYYFPLPNLRLEAA